MEILKSLRCQLIDYAYSTSNIYCMKKQESPDDLTKEQSSDILLSFCIQEHLDKLEKRLSQFSINVLQHQ